MPNQSIVMSKATKDEATEIALIRQDVSYIKSGMTDMRTTLHGNIKDMNETFRLAMTEIKANYVTKGDFELVKKIVYGFVGLILVAVVGALIRLVVLQK